jgi:CubicO group peptidase (beta-lactamase class C family)
MATKDHLDEVSNGPFGSKVTNFAVVEKVGNNAADSVGNQNFTNQNSEKISGSTMFGEGSIGKIRFAGLAYMLQEEGVIDLQTNARDFFASKKVGDFLEKKYPDQSEKLQSEIVKLFADDSAQATLADLTTHRSGIGDLTRDQSKLFEEKGVEHKYTLPELLLTPRDPALTGANQKPKVQTAPHLPDAKYGEHQYSNLGYMLLGLAMETSYDAAKKPEQQKDYKQLMRDYMLHPIEGRAVGKGLSFDQTKFPEDLTASDDLAKTKWLEDGKLADPTKFSGANAAGGMFASADDSTKFFGEFFKGFPRSPETQNPFFSKATIDAMMQESQKFPSCSPDGKSFQGPGFVIENDENSQLISFVKGGGTYGNASYLTVDAKTGEAKIILYAQENVTDEIAKRSDMEISALMGKYSDKTGIFYRYKMLEKEAPEIEITQETEISDAVKEAVEALQKNDATASLDREQNASNLAETTTTKEDKSASH